MVNRADINSVLLQMRQVRQQMQTADPASLAGLQNSIQPTQQNASVGAPQNSFAAQLQQQRSQLDPSTMTSSSASNFNTPSANSPNSSNINPASMTPSQFRNELTQQD